MNVPFKLNMVDKKDKKSSWNNRQDTDSTSNDDDVDDTVDENNEEGEWEDEVEEAASEHEETTAVVSNNKVEVAGKFGSEADDNRVMWTGQGKKIPVIIFGASAITGKDPKSKDIGERYHMTFKAGKTECKVVRQILTSHGFHEVHPNSSDFNLMWTGSHIKPFILRSLQDFQKVNHFPRSYEITRKDRLYKNVQKMQQMKGYRHFDFVPLTFVMPSEFQDFCNAYAKDKGPWIMKPVASSRGRGISLVTSPDQVCLDEPMVICRYLDKPLLVDGFKFDLRMYVLVSSFDPLIIYLYEEGLTRFATVQYDKSSKHVRNQFMHLTNYSVNKKNDDYVMNDDPDVEDFGNKWSMGALLRYLKSLGKDTSALMMRVEDVIIKTIVSAELPIAVACKMFVPWKGNCFELFGFDILIDENLKPWVLEVNLSPSLACESPLDLKIKANMLSDMLSVVGFVCHDPMTRTGLPNHRLVEMARGPAGNRASSALVGRKSTVPLRRGGSAASSSSSRPPAAGNGSLSLSAEEVKIVRRTREEYSRRGGWVRIFPSPDSWELYGSFLQYSSSHNFMLYQQLFPDRAKSLSSKPTGGPSKSRISASGLSTVTQPDRTMQVDEATAHCMQRQAQYERKLCSLGKKQTSRASASNKASDDSSQQSKRRDESSSKSSSALAQGSAQESDKYGSRKMTDHQQSGEGRSTSKQTSDGRLYSADAGTVERRANSVDRREKSATAGLLLAGDKIEASSSKRDEKKKDKSDARKGSALSATAMPYDNSSSKSSTRDNDEQVAAGKASTEIAIHRDSVRASEQPVAATTKASPQVVRRELSEDNHRSHARVKTGDIISLLDAGKVMSKVQARSAFATYLSRVHQRLVNESLASDADDSDASNEQMDLVLRFLKRAAGNLQQPMKVIIPSHKLPPSDRRRILAKELGDFIHIYNRETDQLQQRLLMEERLRPVASQTSNLIDNSLWQRFMHTASEGELEEVLTIYTKINKSASVFLGSAMATKPGGDAPSGGGGGGDAMLHKRRDADRLPLPYEPDNENAALQNVALAYGPRVAAQHSAKRRPHSAAHDLRGPVTLHATRPQSAVTDNNNNNTWAGGRPSAMPQREGPDGAECPPYGSAVAINEDVSVALQRLASKQRARQYSGHGRKLMVLVDDQQQTRARNDGAWTNPNSRPVSDWPVMNDVVKRNSAWGGSQSDVRGGRGGRSSSAAAATFDYSSDEDHGDLGGQAKVAYARVTGVEPRGRNYVPTEGSTQYALLQQQQQGQGQGQVRRASSSSSAAGGGGGGGRGQGQLTEDSRVIHQAMVARAHQAMHQKQQQQQDSALYTPKPPVAPRSTKKPSGPHHRVVSLDNDGDVVTAVASEHTRNNVQSGGLYIKEV